MYQPKLLSRDEFREAVFKRDDHKCVVCSSAAKDAHHIIERRLWEDGGYYVENGASVCEPCHYKCEQTLISCEELRERCGTKQIVLPEHFYDDNDFTYDKWGNIVRPNGTRLKGELFFDESVQKVLEPVLHLFSEYVKYPRTWHLPWSENVKKDDRRLRSTSAFEGEEVVVTLKQDGENTTMYPNYMHARSITAHAHPSRSWVKFVHAQIQADIPEGYRVCGENLYAKHSIHYQNLTSYFQIFSIWDDRNICLSWDDTVEWSQLLGIETVPVLYRGIWDSQAVKAVHKPTFKGDTTEGYVVRLARSFTYGEFRKAMAKFVRKDHVGTHGHWMRSQVIPNKIGGSNAHS